MALKVTPAKDPMEIDIMALEGNRQGETDLAIGSLEGDRLQVCLRNADAAAKGRPTTFTTEGGCWIMRLERIRR